MGSARGGWVLTMMLGALGCVGEVDTTAGGALEDGASQAAALSSWWQGPLCVETYAVPCTGCGVQGSWDACQARLQALVDEAEHHPGDDGRPPAFDAWYSCSGPVECHLVEGMCSDTGGYWCGRTCYLYIDECSL